MDKAKWVGYSNGKTYPVFKIMKDSPKVGLCEIEGWVFLCWCTFEKIERNSTKIKSHDNYNQQQNI